MVLPRPRPPPHPALWLLVAQIITTGVNFDLDFFLEVVPDFLYIWLVAFIWYVIFINLVCDFVLCSIWILNLVWFVPRYRSCRVGAGFNLGKEEIPGDVVYVFRKELHLCLEGEDDGSDWDSGNRLGMDISVKVG